LPRILFCSAMSMDEYIVTNAKTITLISFLLIIEVLSLKTLIKLDDSTSLHYGKIHFPPGWSVLESSATIPALSLPFLPPAKTASTASR
jgi:hypothetical protein